MKKLFPITRKGMFPVFAVLLLVALSTATNVQTAEGASQCTFIVIDPNAGNISSSILMGGGGGSGKPMSLSGLFRLEGACGGVHTNGDLKPGSDDSYAEQGYTYTGSNDAEKGKCGDPETNIDCFDQAPAVQVPEVDPHQYAEFVDYQLRSDGSVYQSDGAGGWTQIGNATNCSDRWNGWCFDSGYWVMGEFNQINGSFFIEGDVKISSSTGTLADPWEATILATGYIQVSGSPVIIPDPNNPPELGNFLLLAGTDIELNGSLGQYMEGIMAAHEQVAVPGSGTLKGCIIAEDAVNNEGLVSEVKISGAVNMQCDTCIWPMPPTILNIIEPF